MKNVKTVLSLATKLLEERGVARARFCSEVLLAHVLKMERIELYMHHDQPLDENELSLFRESIKEKAKKQPLEYLLKEIEFYHCKIDVNSSVLIPRQETEILLDLVCKQVKPEAKWALDLCTGSGCLAIGLKKALPRLGVVGVDLCEKALAVAEKNGKKNGVGVQWLLGDLLEPVMGKKFDLVLCNPPYISDKEFLELDEEVRLFEPKRALVSGKTGLEFYERLAEGLPQILSPGAQIFFEIGAGQKEGVLALFSKSCFQDSKVEPDWAGHDRFFSSIFLENE